jgi:hypothetical protein
MTSERGVLLRFSTAVHTGTGLCGLALVRRLHMEADATRRREFRTCVVREIAGTAGALGRCIHTHVGVSAGTIRCAHAISDTAPRVSIAVQTPRQRGRSLYRIDELVARTTTGGADGSAGGSCCEGQGSGDNNGGTRQSSKIRGFFINTPNTRDVGPTD